MKTLVLRYDMPAENTNEGWEKSSLPIGNGYCGASIFGGTRTERVQFTTNTFANTQKMGGVSNFAELYLHFEDTAITAYERGLRLKDGVAYSRYQGNGNLVTREAFFSYPDRVFAYRIFSERPLFLSVELKVPYLGARTVEEGGRIGQVCVEEGTALVMQGELPSRALHFEGRLSVVCNGKTRAVDDRLQIDGASEIVLFFVMGTSYKLCHEVFFDGNHKAMGKNPHDALVKDMRNALTLGWTGLYEKHAADYGALLSRVTVDLGGEDDGRTTDSLLAAYQNGEEIPYLEELYYAYGRHLLVSSSRNGTLPASLQGVWTVHDKSPWGSGFWHNINIQMNYWPAFTTNLAETFEAYATFWKAYSVQAQRYAEEWIQMTNPENYKQGACGWIIGTGAFCYEIEGVQGNRHSGPGTGGLTAKLFWDYYDFTRDERILRDITYPVIHGAAKFLTKTVREYDGAYLCSLSASPEQILSGDVWIQQHNAQKYYHTVGCAFDQQMLYENARDDLACAQLLGEADEVTAAEQKQIDGYFPVQIGYSGQIKEYGEEHFYGEIGEAKHRHISQLVALMPGNTISGKTPAWLDAAEQTLLLRGDESTGWALAHRLCAWARVGNGEHAYALLKNLLQKRTYPNLWDIHPPFQIDGNFGAVAGVTEMLIQSHDGYIDLLPSIPSAWKRIAFRGLKARGNFTVSCEYLEGRIQKAEIVAPIGGEVRLRVRGQDCLLVTHTNTGEQVATMLIDGVLCFMAARGGSYTIEGFAPRERVVCVEGLRAEWGANAVFLKWERVDRPCVVYRAVEDESAYTYLGTTNDASFSDPQYHRAKKARLTYKIVVGESPEPRSRGTVVFLHPASRLEEERYTLRFHQTNLHALQS